MGDGDVQGGVAVVPAGEQAEQEVWMTPLVI